MEQDDKKPETIDAYISGFVPEVQEMMRTMRAIINETAPQAEERIAWRMATFALNGNLVHFAGQKKHIGFHIGVRRYNILKRNCRRTQQQKGRCIFCMGRTSRLRLLEKLWRIKLS